MILKVCPQSYMLVDLLMLLHLHQCHVLILPTSSWQRAILMGVYMP